VPVPVPVELVVVPVAPEAVLLVDVPPAPSVELSVASLPPLLETPAAVPATPPPFEDAAAAVDELLSPEFSFDCELAGLLPAAAVWPPVDRGCTRVPA
jgi:hypothetical protein